MNTSAGTRKRSTADGRELGEFTNQELAKELEAVLSRGLGKPADELASDPQRRTLVQTFCNEEGAAGQKDR